MSVLRVKCLIERHTRMHPLRARLYNQFQCNKGINGDTMKGRYFNLISALLSGHYIMLVRSDGRQTAGRR